MISPRVIASVGAVVGSLVALTLGGCGQSPLARLPEVRVPLEPTPPPAVGVEVAELEEAEKEEGEEPRGVSGRTSSSHGPQGRSPDPPALRSSVQFELEIRYARGQLTLLDAQERRLPQPMVTPRRMGRFAIELWDGLSLVERVRFDFPLLGAEESPHVSLEKGLITTQKVMVPAIETEHPTRALLVDRATGEEIELLWPPLQFEKPVRLKRPTIDEAAEESAPETTTE